jgi:hypothetical protein
VRLSEKKQDPCVFCSPATNERVPHISLVFREMWDTTALHRLVFRPTGKEHKGSRIPHLAKNERGMGHPLVSGGTWGTPPHRQLRLITPVPLTFDRSKAYISCRMTRTGKKQLEAELETWERLSTAVGLILAQSSRASA